jgi:hypothetical protein
MKWTLVLLLLSLGAGAQDSIFHRKAVVQLVSDLPHFLTSVRTTAKEELVSQSARSTSSVNPFLKGQPSILLSYGNDYPVVYYEVSITLTDSADLERCRREFAALAHQVGDSTTEVLGNMRPPGDGLDIYFRPKDPQFQRNYAWARLRYWYSNQRYYVRFELTYNPNLPQQ